MWQHRLRAAFPKSSGSRKGPAYKAGRPGQKNGENRIHERDISLERQGTAALSGLQKWNGPGSESYGSDHTVQTGAGAGGFSQSDMAGVSALHSGSQH